jgi:hypothetical protein
MKRDKAYYFLHDRGFSSIKKLSMFQVRNLLNDFLEEEKIKEDRYKMKYTWQL